MMFTAFATAMLCEVSALRASHQSMVGSRSAGFGGYFQLRIISTIQWRSFFCNMGFKFTSMVYQSLNINVLRINDLLSWPAFLIPFFWYRSRNLFLTYLISNFDTLIPPGIWILDISLDWFWTCDLHSGIRFWTYAIFSHGIRFWTHLIFNFDTLDTPVWKFWLTYRFWLMGIKIAGQDST